MIVNVEYSCPVSVVVDTETGGVKSVHVWDGELDTTVPVAFHDDSADHAPVESDSPEAVRALKIVNGAAVWPGWQYDA
jgi:hypothetical protein